MRALLAAVSDFDPSDDLQPFKTVQIIRALQEDGETKPVDLCNIELAYLPLLDGHLGVLPLVVEHRLASDSKFYCDVIRARYCTQKEAQQSGLSPEQHSAITSNAYLLLEEWRIVPGLQRDGQFFEGVFIEWLQQIKEMCDDSLHLDFCPLQCRASSYP